MNFNVGDRVKTAGNPFWMTVTSIHPNNGRCFCRFGSIGGEAGSYFPDELKRLPESVPVVKAIRSLK